MLAVSIILLTRLEQPTSNIVLIANYYLRMVYSGLPDIYYAAP
jgi:hypothetical protein